MEEENKKKRYLHVAVCTGDVDQVRDILGSDSSCVNDYNRYFQTSLNLVCNSSYHPDNKFLIMQLLIDYGADVNIRGIHEELPLTLAIEQNHIDGIKLLLQSGADPTWALIKMVNQLEKTSFNVIRILIEHMNLDSYIIEYKYGTLLDKAISLKDFDLMQMLVHLGVKNTNIYKSLLELCDVSSSTLVLLQRLIEYLLSHATEIDSHGHFTLKALKCYMVTYHHDKGHLDKCSLKKYLLEQGIDDDDDLGDSDLHRAVRNGDKELVQSLLEKGSNVNARNNFGDTPLHLLLAVYEPIREEWVFDIAKLLIEYGADLHAHNFLDETPFYMACKVLRDMKLINFMLNKIAGVRISEPPSSDSLSTVNKTAIYSTACYDENKLKLHDVIAAISLSENQLADRLLEMYYIQLARKNYCCRDVDIAMYVAVKKDNYSIVKMLLEAGFRTHRNDDYINYGRLTQISDLRILCLLWEFKDYLMIHTIMKEIFSGYMHYAEQSRLINLLTYYYAIKLRLNNLDAILVPYKGIFKLDSELANILASCNSKLDELKKEKIGIKSMFDLLIMTLDSLVKLLNNPDYLDACQKIFSALDNKTELEYYEYAIKTRLDLAIEKRQLMDIAKDCLKWALQDILIPMKIYTLDHHITWKILSYLTMRDLKRFARN